MNVRDVGGRRRFEDSEFTLHIYPETIAEGTIYCPITAKKNSTAAEVIDSLINKLQLDRTKCYVLAEVKEFGGEEWILNPTDCPVQRMMLWPRMALENRISGEDYRFLLREKNLDGSIHYGSLQSWLRVTEERRRMMERGFLPQPQHKDYDDLCSLPDLNEKTLLENLRHRFKEEKIYTYVGSILIVINPFKFLPIYNPKYVKMYDNHQLGKLEPHIYAVADVAYHAMLQRRRNQCIVISGESGSGKTQSTNFLIHHLTALSQKGFASGVEQIILGAGPVLEAFGNAKTAHNNNSSRFGKFIQVNYQEMGTVRGAYVEKYLLEKSRLVYQEHNERNYHVFYYLLAGASDEERLAFHLKKPEEYHYLNQDCFSVEGEDLKHDFERLQLAMEMVGFLPKTRRQIFSLLSAILHLGNIRYKKKTYRDDSIDICNPEVLPIVSELLEVKEELLFEALITRKTVTVGERLVLPYSLSDAITVRDSMAKSLYSALFDWIVFRINHALLNTKDLEENTKTLSIGVLDIFGFEDYESNSFEQFCINFANERLQYYFNQHIFKLEQEEYRAEGISWHNIDYIDNSSCIQLISKKPTGLLQLLDEESNFPQATNQTLLEKFKRQHEGNGYIEFPAVMEPAFIIKHYAGKVKYGVKDFREKNTDHMRPDIVALLRSSKNAFICGMIGIEPVVVFRWAVLRAFFRAMVAFRQAGKRHAKKKIGIPRKNPRTPLSSLQGVNTLNEKAQWDNYGVGWNGRTGTRQHRLSTSGTFLEDDGIFVNSNNSKLLERAHGILMRNRNVKTKLSLPKHLLDVKSLKHLTSLTLHDRITKSLLHLHKKKKPPSISAQFQASLNKLMDTLGQAEPYFVKCIRSNAEKLPLRFKDSLVLRQLRYTGMLETVRIRQSGYSCKYSFQDFVDHFHVLLSRKVLPTKPNIQDFFWKGKHSPDDYQVGRTMVFMKEKERQRLQDMLHQEVLQRITLLQRWFRAKLCRRHFLTMRQAALIIQTHWRSWKQRKHELEHEIDPLILYNAAVLIQSRWRGFVLRQKFLRQKTAAPIIQNWWRKYAARRQRAATCLQAVWRGYQAKNLYRTQRKKIIQLQSAVRGYSARCRLRALKEQRLKEKELEDTQQIKEEDRIGIEMSVMSNNLDILHCKHSLLREGNGPVLDNFPESHLEHLDDRTEDLTYQQHERGPGILDPCMLQGVSVRERRKSLEDLNQKKGVRAKRESRRMRELEQAQFSLELLKGRITGGGLSPSDEQRASIELTVEDLPSPLGTLDSEGSQGSLDLLHNADSQSKIEVMISDDQTSEQGMAENSFVSSPTQLNSIAVSHWNVSPIQQRTPSGCELPESPLESYVIATYKPHPREPLVSSSLPTFYIPLQDSHKTNRGLSENHSQSTQLAQKESADVIHNRNNLQPEDLWTSNYNISVVPTAHRSAEGGVIKGSTDPVLVKLQRLNEEKKERQKQLQQHNERELMQKIRHEKDILERQRKAFEQQDRDEYERLHCETLSISTTSQVSRKSSERPLSLLVDLSAPTEVSVPSQPVAIKGLTVGQREDLSIHPTSKDRPVSMFLERSEGITVVGEESNLTDRWGQKQQGGPKDFTSKAERFRQPWLTNKSMAGSIGDRTSVIFFTPKENYINISNLNMSSTKQASQQLGPGDGPSKKPEKGLLSSAGEVSLAAHKKKARMARTRSDFLTRGTFAAGEGDSEEDDSDEHPESPISPEQPHPLQLGSAAYHSDSEMSLLRSTSEEPAKLLKTKSQGEIAKLPAAPKNSLTDGRPQKGKMRFWGKGKQGEKKLPRDKLTTQSELLELYSDHDTPGVDLIPKLQFNEVIELGRHRTTPPRSPELLNNRGKEKENKEPSPKVKRRRSLKISSSALEPVSWQNDAMQIINSASDLKGMDDFLIKKMHDLDNEDSKKDTLVDVVFKKALKEFRQNIFSQYTTALTMDDSKSIRYKDLNALFEQILEKTMRLEQRDWNESPVRVWVNTFKVFLDEFMTEYKPLENTSGKVPKTERKKRRKKESDILEEHMGHIFKATQYSIPTYCEFCSSLIWIMDRAAVCKLCKYACHKKCCLRTSVKCSKKYDPELSSRQFAVELSRLTSEDRAVPLLAEKLINYIEMHGLYTEGIYRKSGSTNKIKELRQGLDTDIDNVNLDDYNIHVIASVFKQWLRDLPNPLMTFELYEEFLRAMGLQERRETLRGVYCVIDQLSRTHLNTLERLIFHLVRIVQEEETNRMSANALAIVFAPCILRCPDTTDPLQSVKDISKTTACIELIVVEQMNKYRARLKDISSLEFAENKAKSRLSLIHRSMGKGNLRRRNYPSQTSPITARLPSVADVPEETASSEETMDSEGTEQQQVAMQQEERVLTEQIENLQKEKVELAFEILALEPRASDDETLESEASIGTADSSENVNFDSEGTVSNRSERSSALSSPRSFKTEASSRMRRQMRKQNESVDSVDSAVSSQSSTSSSCLPHMTKKRFHIHARSPFYRGISDSSELRPTLEDLTEQPRGLDDRPQFTTRGTFNPEKGKLKLKNVKNVPQKTKELLEGGATVAGRKRPADPDGGSTNQQLVLFGSNEFMV
ncbi:unconventional myosin-IXa isoform X2 [Lissotriton helveticus]